MVRFRGRSGRLYGGARDLEPEGRSAVGHPSRAHRPAVPLGHLPHDGEAEAEPGIVRDSFER